MSIFLSAQYNNEISENYDGIEYYMATDQAVYSIGDSVHMTYKITNLSDSPISFIFPSTQRYDFFIMRNDSFIWCWSWGLGFITLMGEIFLNPGDSTQAFASWSDQTYPGLYEVTGFYTYDNYDTVYLTVDILFSQVDVSDNSISLSQCDLLNYPNPFNPNTMMKFSIVEDCNVKLSIYNIKGRIIKKLVTDFFRKGEYSVLWEGIDDSGEKVDSGIYFYKLDVNGKTKSIKKCLLLK
jgi:hypothetical protein